MLKRITAIMLAMAMLLSIAPRVLAEVQISVPSTEVVDLIHDSNGDVRDGVVPSYYPESATLGGSGDIYTIIDGNDSSQNGNETTYFGAAGAYYQIDLGSIKTVTNIKYSMMLYSFDYNLWRCEQYRIKISNDPDFAEYETVASVGDIYNGTDMPRHCVVDLSGNGEGYDLDDSITGAIETTGDGFNHTVTFAGGPKKCRYIRVENIMWNNMCCDEISVMGSECSKDSFGEWSIADENDGTLRTFEMPIAYENSDNAHNFDVVVANYDDEGYMTKAVKSLAGDADGITADIDITDADTKSIAVAIPDDGDYLFTPPVATYGFDGFGADIGKADSFDNAVEVYTTETSFTADVKTVSEDDLVVAAAVRSDEDNADDAFEAATEYAWYGAANSDNGYSFDMNFEEEGQYFIRVSRYPVDGEVEYKDYSFTMVDLEIRNQAIAGIIGATDDASLKAAVDFAVAESQMISEGALLDMDIFEEDGIYDIFGDISDIMKDDEVSLAEVIDILNTATVVYALNAGDLSVYENHPEYIDNNADVKNYVQDVLGFSYTLDITSDVPNGSIGVTNCGESGVITYTFNENMNPSTLNPTNIIIKKNGSKISYSPYKKNSTTYVIDKTILSPNSSYTVTFTGGCKTAPDGRKIIGKKEFSFTTGEIINAPYKEGYIIKNVALGKNIAEVTTQFGAASEILDGSKDKLILFSDDVLIDLGDYYDVFRINIAGPDPDRYYHLMEVMVKESEGDPTFAEGASVLYTYPIAETELRKLLDHTIEVNSGKIRYFKLDLEPISLLMSEFSAYAYVKTEFGGWTVPSFNGAGNYTFSKAITENTDHESYYMLINAYDGNGMTVASKIAEVEVTNGALTNSISIPSSAVGASATIVKDLQSMEQLTDPITIGQPIVEDGTADLGVSIASDDFGVHINAGKNDSIKNTSRLLATIVATSESGVSAQEAYQAMTASQMQSNMVFESAARCEDGIKYLIDDLPEGKYYIRTTLTNLDGSIETKYYKTTVVGDTQKESIIDDFANADSAGIGEWITDTFDNLELLNDDDLEDTSVIDNTNYHQLVVYTRDMLYPDSENITSLTDIIKVLDAAALLQSFCDADSLKVNALIKSSGSYLGENFDAEVDVADFLYVFGKLKSKIDSSSNLAKVLRRSYMLSYMHNGTNEDKVKVLTNYKDEFGIDTTYPQTKKVSIERAAEFLSISDVSIYYEDGKLSEEFEKAVKKAVAAKQSTSQQVSGGGGGVSMPSDTKSGSTSAPKQTPAPQKVVSSFNDMQNHGWANDAVNSLYEKGILKGYDDGSFRPQNNVTRAEFIKMMTVATKIQVVEQTPMNFIDVPGESWYYPYIRVAYTNKLCSGVSEYYFEPDALITRQDIAVLINNYMRQANINASGTQKQFTDSANISDYAVNAIKNVSAAGIINGYDDGTFRPSANATRAEAAMIISKIIN